MTEDQTAGSSIENPIHSLSTKVNEEQAMGSPVSNNRRRLSAQVQASSIMFQVLIGDMI